MYKQKPFPFSLIILILLIVLHTVGSYYSWYWVYPWFDLLVHIMSGLWIALTILWLSSYLGQINSLKEYKVKSFLIAFLSAILFGVVWEMIENMSQITFVSVDGYYLDTAGDIISDGLGGVLAFWYFVRRAKCLDKTAEVLHPFYNQTSRLIEN